MISVVILAPNQDSISKRTSDSLSFADEVIHIPVSDDFAQARNEGMEEAEYEWILFIDSDEEESKELAENIGKLDLNQTKIGAFSIPRRDFFWGTELKYGETNSARNEGIIRLVKKGSGKWVGKVHEVFQTSGATGALSGFINHYPHQTIAAFLESINNYSTLRAQELKGKGVRTNVFQIIMYPFGKFWYTYLLKLGFLDGPAGFVYSFMMSFHSFLVRSKLYLKQ
ncbi:MAG: glycosyltransferase family 2 protein [Microgenomates group bacterium]